ncbi:pyruvate dehydrogenase E1 component beta subunit [Kibdelosporangium banguiense]|uniref:Pyruvate dehydrogenase E1 component beta subunit n=1 Tax=Kibdelosporangium banguiense TaxID=1365924 RepID=A0ABS4TQW3_9PSEU|nr:transketolase C-terminal domain-containing protein [Kibdelosporangium banguiense]MBP2326807.1 pyruvate dehydrogenase E1 component beta subunit [Kibdelosporangium banguiense]
MIRTDRVVDNLNSALHRLFADDDTLYLLGEDVADPYGGAFKVSAGLSTAFPDRVISTPISENGIAGVANGLALCGNRVLVEIMFGDFVTLAFDQIVNVAAKSVSMYGRRRKMSVIVRCPMGGNRGYGPTHSQSLQKHFLGVPDLLLFEMSPLHDNLTVLRRMLDLGRPCMFFENKPVYGERTHAPGPIDDLFRFDFLDAEGNWARVSVDDTAGCLLIAPGGMVSRALAAARRLLLEHEIDVTIVVPSQLYPVIVEPILDDARRARHVFVVQECTPGGSWGHEVAQSLHELCWDDLNRPVTLIQSRDSVIPAARHLERRAVVQADDIVDRVVAACANVRL